MFYVYKLTFKNLDDNFFEVEAIKLTSAQTIFVCLLWLLCHLQKSNLFACELLLPFPYLKINSNFFTSGQ